MLLLLLLPLLLLALSIRLENDDDVIFKNKVIIDITKNIKENNALEGGLKKKVCNKRKVATWQLKGESVQFK